ncbi:MAG TPA: alkaline phosphatase family protein, partial [Caulobacteraceae bacterium]|nr:alkaline phosphatase family protein [Caulobacteraceae bacterium]
MRRRWLQRLATMLCAVALAHPGLGRAADLEGVPRYAHIFVIVEENKDYAQIMDPASAPNIAGLARAYGDAAQFFGEVHPSEANYVAMLAGDTFGIHDDDAYYCKPGDTRPYCWGALAPGYVDHTVRARHLGDQLTAAGLSWKGYYETIPQPG